MSPSSPADAERVVPVWHATVDAALPDRDEDTRRRALDLLGPAERDRYGRFRHDLDRRMFLLGRVMARTLVGAAIGRPAADWPWGEGPRGRPEVALPDCPVSFNVAHSAGLVVCALSPYGPVGVDVEHRARRPLERALVARCCASDEAADVNQYGDAWGDQFLKYWTLKESYLKAVGLGISVHLPDVRFQLGAEPRAAFTGALRGQDVRWRFALQAAEPAHYVAVALTVPDGREARVDHRSFGTIRWS